MKSRSFFVLNPFAKLGASFQMAWVWDVGRTVLGNEGKIPVFGFNALHDAANSDKVQVYSMLGASCLQRYKQRYCTHLPLGCP